MLNLRFYGLAWRRMGQAFTLNTVLAALAVVDWRHIALSVLGAVVPKLALAIHHRPGRCMAMSRHGCDTLQPWGLSCRS